MSGKKALFALMQGEARRGDGTTSYGSDGNQATALGVSRPTVRRWKCQLEAAGAVKRDGYHQWGPLCKTVRFRLRVTQEVRSNTPRTSRRNVVGVRYVVERGSRRERASSRCGRRRRLMEKHPERLADGVVRVNGEVTAWNAGDAIAATVVVCRGMGIPIAPSIKARLGKGAKSLLEAGFEPLIVVEAMVAAIRNGWFGSVESLAQEMAVTTSGYGRSREQWRRTLAETRHQLTSSESSVWQMMRDELDRRENRRIEA